MSDWEDLIPENTPNTMRFHSLASLDGWDTFEAEGGGATSLTKIQEPEPSPVVSESPTIEVRLGRQLRVDLNATVLRAWNEITKIRHLELRHLKPHTSFE